MLRVLKVVSVSVFVVTLMFARTANAAFQNNGHWRRPLPISAGKLHIRVVDGTNDSNLHSQLILAAADWNNWSPDLQLDVETGTCTPSFTASPNGVICIVAGDLTPLDGGCCYWGYTFYNTKYATYLPNGDGLGGGYSQYMGVEVMLDLSRVVGDEPRRWITTHELGHAIGLGHMEDQHDIMYPTWTDGFSQSGPSSADLTDLHTLYSQIDPYELPVVKALKPTSGKVGQVVVVSGTNLAEVNSVTLNGQDVGSLSTTSTTVTFTVPAGAKTGPVVVRSPAGAAAKSLIFTVKLK